MRHLRWLLARSMKDSSQTYGAAELFYTPWFVDSYHLRILKLQTCTRKYWQVTTKFQSSCLRTVLISFLKFWIRTPRSDMALKKFETILGLNNKKTKCLEACFLGQSRCRSTTSYISRCSMSLIMTLIIQSSASKPTGTIRSRQPITCSVRGSWDRTKTSWRIAILPTWLEVSTEMPNHPEYSS